MNTITLDGGVKRQFVLPAVIVLSAHAAIFFGFVKTPPVNQLLPKHPTTSYETPLLPVMIESGQEGDNPVGGRSSQQQLPDIPNPVSPTGPETPAIPITPELPSSPIGFSGAWSPSNGPGSGASTVVQTYNPDLLDHTPHAVRQTQPVYPLDAKVKSESGEVMVAFVVDESGRVLNARVVSSTDPVFEEPTLRAIEQWRFTPGTVHGRPVRFRMSVPVAFSLDG
jgi:protein TonB